MNRENNVYTILYASIMVIIVAIGLAFTHQSLSERQTKNINIDKMQQIILPIVAAFRMARAASPDL